MGRPAAAPRLVVEELRRYLGELTGVRALDIGCGSGGLAIALAKAGATVDAVEPDPVRRAWAAARIRGHDVNVTLHAAYAEGLPFSTDTFSLVTLDSVIEHVESPTATLREVTRVLKAGGIVYSITPNKSSVINILRDPHYRMLGVVLLPRRLGKFYVERESRIEVWGQHHPHEAPPA